MKKDVLILGAGFGGLELATKLAEEHGDAVDVTLLDRNDAFFFGFSKLEVMLGRQTSDEIKLPYADVKHDTVAFRQETVTAIDPATRRVTTDGGTYDPDFLVIAMGADYDLDATPGFAKGGSEYYTLAGAERMRDTLSDFKGGKVLVSVLRQPFKCPPAPFEGAFLLHERFTEMGIDFQMTMTFPMQRPVPVTGDVSQMFRDGLAERHIEERPQTTVTAVDGSTAQLETGETLDYDLFVGIPVHKAPSPLDGWVEVDQANLRTGHPGVYAIGDVCTGARTVPKAGIFAEAAAHTVADDIAATITGGRPPEPYGGSGICYAEFGGGLVSKVEVNFLGGDAPAARPYGATLAHAREKDDFGAVRRARWFGR